MLLQLTIKMFPRNTDYDDIFSEEEAGILALHCDHDHVVNTESGISLPLQPIYPLSQNELGILWDYIHTALSKGWICPSTSPADASILFASKKNGGLRLCIDY